MGKPAKAAPPDPTAGWSDEKIVAEFIKFAENSADDSGPTSEMAHQALAALGRLVVGTGSTEADGELVAALANAERVAQDVLAHINVRSTNEALIKHSAELVGVSQYLRDALSAAGSTARAKMVRRIDVIKADIKSASERIAAHLFRP